MYWVSVSESGWLSTSQGSTDPGDTKRAAGSKVVEAAVCPWKARPSGDDDGGVGVDELGGGFVPSDFILASSASSSRIRC